eukprot:TRINITY_DN52124_c0_g1_i1.p2 TRINITY_DN52124_c0_g1~~TRINITY_DN52124_c0_g1_i1.p2  ORF type:complete len:124 (-),score=34.59 TRINITY_DN52124_c0_g1_i1:38-409(-)
MHHAACVLGIGASLAMKRGSAACAGLFIAELSTPLYNLRWLLLATGGALKYPKLYERVSLGFVGLFIGARMGFGSVLTKDIAGSANPRAVKLAAGGVWGVSFLWAVKMVQQVLEHYRGTAVHS